MATVLDYLDWRGDIPISPDFPLNEVDTVVLCLFSYLEMEKLEEVAPPETIGSVCEKAIEAQKENRIGFHMELDKELIRKLVVSKRFSSLRVSDFSFFWDKETQQQFCAVCIHLPQDEIVMAFRGTDSTVVGWKEDLNMAFMNEIPAQASALEFAKMVGEKYENKRLRLMGHSKGGNIALYAAFYLPPQFSRRIVRVDNLDGPGFCRKVIEENKTDDLIPKMHTYFPTGSIIGRLLEHLEDHVVIESSRMGVFQHDLYSWQVGKEKINRGEALTNQSEVISGMFTRWLEETSLEQRALFADAIYTIYSSTETESVKEFHRSLIKNAPAIIKAYRGIDPDERKQALKMLGLFVRTYVGSFKDTVGMKDLEKTISMEMGEVFPEFNEVIKEGTD